jgi:hypothetical protein
MKKIHSYILFFVITVLFSCKKDHSKDLQPLTDKKKHVISFNLSAFSQQIVGSSNKLSVNSVVSDTGSIRSMFQTIGYAVFDSTGNLIKVKKYNAKTYVAGAIKDTLATGKYTIGIYAGQQGCDVYGGFLTYGYASINSIGMGEVAYTYNVWKDTFAKVFIVNIQHTDISQGVQLERIVGEIELNIKDNIPANAYSIALTSSVIEYSTYLLYSGSVGGSSQPYGNPNPTVIIPDSSKNKPNFKFTYLTPYTGTAFPITFTCSDATGNVISQKVFNNNIVQKNQRVIYSGNLFGTPSTGNSFQPTVSTTWDPNPINISF